MIGSEYFKRQAMTLRKLIGVTKNPKIADHLIFLADEFESRAQDGPVEADGAAAPPVRRSESRDQRR